MTAEIQSFVSAKLTNFNTTVIVQQNINTTRSQIASQDVSKNSLFNSTYSNVTSGVQETTIYVSSLVDGYQIPVVVYTPSSYSKNKSIVVYCHGGGYSIYTTQSYRPSLMMLAYESNAIWLSVEYRLAPEYKFPTGLDDCKSVVQYAINNKTLINVNAVNASVGVAGDDSGANFAAVISNELQDQLQFQILIYGILYGLLPTDSKISYMNYEYLLPLPLTMWFTFNYFSNYSQTASSRFAANTGIDQYTKVPNTLLISSQ